MGKKEGKRNIEIVKLVASGVTLNAAGKKYAVGTERVRQLVKSFQLVCCRGLINVGTGGPKELRLYEYTARMAIKEAEVVLKQKQGLHETATA